MPAVQPISDTPAFSLNLQLPQPAQGGAGYADPLAAAPASGHAVSLRISAEARSALVAAMEAEPPADFDAALLATLGELGREAAKLFAMLGMTPDEAREASRALIAAVRSATESFRFQLDAGAAGNWLPQHETADGFSYRASLTVEGATVRWDSEAGRFAGAVERVGLSPNVQSGTLLASAGVAEAIAGRNPPLVRIDAAVPVREKVAPSRPAAARAPSDTASDLDVVT